MPLATALDMTRGEVYESCRDEEYIGTRAKRLVVPRAWGQGPRDSPLLNFAGTDDFVFGGRSRPESARLKTLSCELK